MDKVDKIDKCEGCKCDKCFNACTDCVRCINAEYSEPDWHNFWKDECEGSEAPHKDGCHEGFEIEKEDKVEDLSQWYSEYI